MGNFLSISFGMVGLRFSFDFGCSTVNLSGFNLVEFWFCIMNKKMLNEFYGSVVELKESFGNYSGAPHLCSFRPSRIAQVYFKVPGKRGTRLRMNR